MELWNCSRLNWGQLAGCYGSEGRGSLCLAFGFPTDKVHCCRRKFVSREAIKLGSYTETSQSLQCTGANMGFLADHFETRLYRQFHEFWHTQAVLILQRIVPKPPFSLVVLQVVDEGNRLVKERIVVVAADVMHG